MKVTESQLRKSISAAIQSSLSEESSFYTPCYTTACLRKRGVRSSSAPTATDPEPEEETTATPDETTATPESSNAGFDRPRSMVGVRKIAKELQPLFLRDMPNDTFGQAMMYLGLVSTLGGLKNDPDGKKLKHYVETTTRLHQSNDRRNNIRFMEGSEVLGKWLLLVAKEFYEKGSHQEFFGKDQKSPEARAWRTKAISRMTEEGKRVYPSRADRRSGDAQSRKSNRPARTPKKDADARRKQKRKAARRSRKRNRPGNRREEMVEMITLSLLNKD